MQTRRTEASLKERVSIPIDPKSEPAILAAARTLVFLSEQIAVVPISHDGVRHAERWRFRFVHSLDFL